MRWVDINSSSQPGSLPLRIASMMISYIDSPLHKRVLLCDLRGACSIYCNYILQLNHVRFNKMFAEITSNNHLLYQTPIDLLWRKHGCAAKCHYEDGRNNKVRLCEGLVPRMQNITTQIAKPPPQKRVANITTLKMTIFGSSETSVHFSQIRHHKSRNGNAQIQQCKNLKSRLVTSEKKLTNQNHIHNEMKCQSSKAYICYISV
jgi:hypothetical protein